MKSKTLALLAVTLLWRPPFGEMNDCWSCAMSATAPYVDLDITADFVTGGTAAKLRSSLAGTITLKTRIPAIGRASSSNEYGYDKAEGDSGPAAPSEKRKSHI